MTESHSALTEDEEIERFMAMSEQELQAMMTPEDWIELERLGKQTQNMLRCFNAGWNAALEASAKTAEKTKEVNGDYLGYTIADAIKDLRKPCQKKQ